MAVAATTDWLKEKGKPDSAAGANDGDVAALYAVWDGKVLIHKRADDPKGISTPGGGCDATDTDFSATVVREAVEEAGLTIDRTTLKVLQEPAATGRKFVYFYAMLTTKPTLDPTKATLLKEVDAAYDFAGAGIKGETAGAGTGHWWAPIDDLIAWLNDPKNAALKIDYVVKALTSLKGKLPAAGTGAGAGAGAITFRGIPNVGNSCFFASGLQILRLMPSISAALLTWTKYTPRTAPTTPPVLGSTPILPPLVGSEIVTYEKQVNALKSIMEELAKSDSNPVDITAHYATLLGYKTGFAVTGTTFPQQDVSEFLNDVVFHLMDRDAELSKALSDINIQLQEAVVCNPVVPAPLPGAAVAPLAPATAPVNTKTNILQLRYDISTTNNNINTLINNFSKPANTYLKRCGTCTFKQDYTKVGGSNATVTKGMPWVEATHGPLDADKCTPNATNTHTITGVSKNLIFQIGRGQMGASGNPIVDYKTEVKITPEITINSTKFYATAAILKSGPPTGGHYWLVTFKEDTADIELVANDAYVGPAKSTEPVNTNAIMILYSKNKITTAAAGGAAAATATATATTTTTTTTTTTATATATSGLRRKAGSALNSAVRDEFDKNTGANPINEVITKTLNIFGDIYNLQVHEEMVAAPATLVQFMTDYGINIEYGMPIVNLIKAFYDIFPNGGLSKGGPVDDYATRPAFHVICNYLKYRVLTLRFELQLKRLSNLHRSALKDRSDAIESMLEAGQCGKFNPQSALNAFVSGLTAAGTAPSVDLSGIEAKIDQILALLSGPDDSEIESFTQQLERAEAEIAGGNPSTLSNDELKKMLQRLGRVGPKTETVFDKITALLNSTKAVVAAAAPATPGAAPAAVPATGLTVAEAEAKAKADMDALLKVVQPDLGDLITRITSDMRKGSVTPSNFKAILSYLDNSRKVAESSQQLFTQIAEFMTYLNSLRGRQIQLPPPAGSPAGTPQRTFDVNDALINDIEEYLNEYRRGTEHSVQNLRAALYFLKAIYPLVGKPEDKDMREMLGAELEKLAPLIKNI